ncbi:hypothetical protein G1H11_05150 [Phytoactinopolyspora alkaliphila]|uniref:Uncharacterized protein n=1 Tax=Phytoactinopolyspora alkaliphila TaxID=1783498 RepID=A0A6N9YIA4_9ACTN|nr:hypothetical protein [Phytoactinopolyspora alkaliphila]NED94692.1 hypothetical protein [Phytoactinopolyspora alkaliphila]
MEPKAHRRRLTDMRPLVVVLLALVLMSCGNEPASNGDRTAAQAGTAAEEAEGSAEELEMPPDVVVTGGDEELSLTPYVFCWSSGCVDGAPPETVPEVGSPGQLTVEFPVEGWEFLASFQAAGDTCARTQTLELEPLSATTYALPPAGPAGTYDVDLFGRRDGDGDVVVRFRWTTPEDGPSPAPEAMMAVLADNDGTVDSYGVELSVVNLAASPETVEANVTVTAAGGETLTYQPTPANHAPEGCSSVEGALFWEGPAEKGLEAAALGDAPFTYTVELVLDGVSHVATAVWPDDEMPDYAPSVPLTFEPELPAVT